MVTDTVQLGCTCGGCIAFMSGSWWLLHVLTILLFVAVVLDFYHIWRRCRERNAKMERIINKTRPLKAPGEVAHASEGSCRSCGK